MTKIIKWLVIKWNQLWRTIWFNTANIECNNNDIEDGVYKINIVIDWTVYNWAWCFRKNINIFESHIFNFNKNIYWKIIEIIILEKIRENKKINNTDELKLLIQNDIKKINNIKYNVLTFWTFDIVHAWHEYYLKQSKKYSDKLITIIATDKNIEKLKWKPPIYNINERIKFIKELNISDKVIAWDEFSPLKWLDIYKPKIICLWYDQIWFSSKLKEIIIERKLKIEIIRIKSYKKNICKSSILRKQKI